MRVIIAGSRDFNNFAFLDKECIKIFRYLSNNYNTKATNVEIISGTARGADQLGEKFAAKYGLSIKLFPAEWDKFGKSAGYKRNEQMAEYAKKDSELGVLIAFWDGKSKGTKHMIDLAERYDIKVFTIDVN